ncbi:beta-galactosidase [soil metagenome]
MKFRVLILLITCVSAIAGTAQARTLPFVTVDGHVLKLNGQPYYFVGANYWYGGLLGLEKDKKRGVERLRRELDFLKANGVTNLRLMAGAEGSGLMNGVNRVGPSLQPQKGKFDEKVLEGLDLVLYEMGKRQMKAVIFLSNNWEWSGGFQQYLIWEEEISDEWLAKKPTWDELRDNVAKFYSCSQCMISQLTQTGTVVTRTNSLTKKKYTTDPTIMAWELANEPRPMRPIANEAYRKWVLAAAALIKSFDKDHLVSIGHEGYIGTQDIALFETVHRDKNVDYLTIHIWPKNWGWFENGKMADGFSKVVTESEKYISENAAVAVKLNKPMVIEEFGLPRDGQSFDPAAATSYRDKYYSKILSFIGNQSGGREHIAGANFWAFGGTARPKNGQAFWKTSDELMGDPPMEEQGLNSVFDSDVSTWNVIRSFTRRKVAP